jgi:outer membrane protein assembly factor BamD (BamD/ComL family)
MAVSRDQQSKRIFWPRRQRPAAAAYLALALFATGTSGCASNTLAVFKGSQVPPPPAETLVIRAGHLEEEPAPKEGSANAQLAGAHELYRKGEYDQAERIYHKIADNKKNLPAVAEEARYYEAESLRRQSHYPKASDTYAKLLVDFPNSAYREQAVQHIYDIANYWLDDTREEMRERHEKEDGKRWWVGSHFVNWDKSKPFLDEEGRALEALQRVQFGDIRGPLADKALFLAGSVKFFNKNYRDADLDFSQLVEHYPNSPFAPQAIELAIIAKHMSTGGSDYDGRKVAEARQMVDTALRSYPELAAQKDEFLKRHLVSITMQQAEKDFKRAEYYRRTGHPGSAYFCYEIVRRRYPNTKFAEDAVQHMNELRDTLQKEQETAPTGDSSTSALGFWPFKKDDAPADKVPQAPRDLPPPPRQLPSGGLDR